jgi:choline oxidase
VRAVEYDYVVVGGGTAGCVVAARIAEDPDVTVCLIEGGTAFEHDPLVLGYHGAVPLLGNPLYDYDYEIVAQARGNSRIRHSRAKMLGGCSSHNDTVAFRPPQRDLVEWERLGAAGWGPDGTRAYFERAMAQANVNRAPGRSPCARAVHEAACSLGLVEADVLSDPLGDAAGWLYLNERDGIRQSTAVAYLYPLSGLPANLTLMTETWVDQVVVDDGGVATEVATGRGPVRAREEIILCAGAIDTPRLLMLSGIGPADRLRKAGRDVRHELPAVGERLQDHLEAPVMWESTRDTGPSLQNAESALFTRSRPELEAFDTFFHVITQPYYVALEIDGRRLVRPERGFCIVPNVPKPKSLGTLRLNPQAPEGPPLIDPGYLTDPGGEDERLLIEGIRFAREVADQPALRDWIVREVAPGPAIADDAALSRYVRQASNTVYHPSGTCAMGDAGDAAAVVDPELRVRGLERLRIADASVFPSIVSVNLCLTVMMIGERCADLVRR